MDYVHGPFGARNTRGPALAVLALVSLGSFGHSFLNRTDLSLGGRDAPLLDGQAASGTGNLAPPTAPTVTSAPATLAADALSPRGRPSPVQRADAVESAAPSIVPKAASPDANLQAELPPSPATPDHAADAAETSTPDPVDAPDPTDPSEPPG